MMWAWPVLGVVVAGGALCNLLLLATASPPPVLRALAAADLCSLLLLAVPEALALTQAGVWTRPLAACRLFLGAETLLSSATVYLLVVVNLDAACPSPSLAAPLLAVWLVAASLSVPAFALGGLSAEGVCRLPAAAALLSAAFRLAVPALLLVAGALVAVLARPARGLPLALALSTSYLAVSGQRAVLALLHAADVAGHPVASLCLSLAHYALAAVRPVLSWTLMPEPDPPAHGEPDDDQDH